jgi:hypothetical protein
MESTTWSNAIAAGALAVALVGYADGRVRTNRNERETREARERADRATAAADRSAHAQERMARALELQSIARAQAAAEPEVAWQLKHHGGDRYLLENVGTATAFDVMVKAPEGLIFRAPSPDIEDLPPRGSTTFMAVRTFGTRDDTITVQWADHSGSEHRQTWQRALPPK